MAGEEAIVIHMLEKKIVRKFRDQCATDPRQAMTLESAGIRHKRIAKRLIKRQILLPTTNDRYYLDEEAAELHFRKRRIAAFAAIVIGIIIALVFSLLKK